MFISIQLSKKLVCIRHPKILFLLVRDMFVVVNIVERLNFMFGRFVCFLLGHKKMRYNCLERSDKMLYQDQLGQQILHLRFCERCHTAFFELGE
jgi:hypothetical protein